MTIETDYITLVQYPRNKWAVTVMIAHSDGDYTPIVVGEKVKKALAVVQAGTEATKRGLEVRGISQ